MSLPVATSTRSNIGAYITYNGYSFLSPKFRSRIEMIPEVSADQRTTLCNTYRLTVRALVTDDQNAASAFMNRVAHTAGGNNLTDLINDQYNSRSHLQKIRALLSKNGGRLTIRGLGFDIDVNGGNAGSIFDVRWGPWTRHLTFDNIGNGVVHEVNWVCEFSIPECYNSDGTGHIGHEAGTSYAQDISYINFPYAAQGDVEGLAFDVAYTVNRSGLTQRVISGEVSIAMNRASATGEGAANKILAVADSIREQIQPAVPKNFQRISQNWHNSPDFRRLRFVIVDEELPGENSYPVGILDITLEHSVSATSPMLPIAPQLNCNFSGSFETTKGYSASECLDRVFAIISSRLDKARDFYILNGGVGNCIFITGLSISESLFGARRVTFSLDYMMMNLGGAILFGGVVERTALFNPTDIGTGNNWEDWSDDLIASGVWGQRGLANLSLNPDSNPIVGPCDGTPDALLADIEIPPPVTAGGGSFVTECPPEGKDYLYSDYTFETFTDNKTVIHTPMGPAPSGATPALTEIKSDDQATVTSSYRQPSASTYSTRASYLSPGSVFHIRLSFAAIRLGAPPEIPSVNADTFHTKFSNGRLAAGDTYYKNTPLGKLGKCAMYLTKGYIDYTLTLTYQASDIQDIIGIMRDSLTLTPNDPEGDKVGGNESGR